MAMNNIPVAVTPFPQADVTGGKNSLNTQQQLLQLKRRQAIADQLQGYAQKPIETQISGTANHPIAVNTGYIEPISKIVSALIAAKYNEGNDEQYRKILAAMDAQKSAAVSKLGPGYGDQQAAIDAGVSPEVIKGLQDMSKQSADLDVQRRGQDITSRGQDLNAQTTVRGQDITSRGQDLTNNATLRGQDIGANTSIRGQDIGAQTAARGQDITMRGQDLTSQTEASKIAATSAKEKPLTEFQQKAVGQLTRMQGAEQELAKINYQPTYGDKAADSVPGVGNSLVGNSYQQQKQAANDFIAGLLRLDSGAAVPETEFNRYYQTFFPQPGDSPDVVAQKEASRQRAMDAVRTGLQGAGDLVPKPTSVNPDLAAAAKAEMARRGLK